MGEVSEFPDVETDLTRSIIKGAIEVHKIFGPGLLESAYKACLLHELIQEGLKVESEKFLPIFYKDIKVEKAFSIDIWVERKVVVELKTVEKILPIHEAQLLTYMKLSKSSVGLIINFNAKLLRDGIRRMALTLD